MLGIGPHIYRLQMAGMLCASLLLSACDPSENTPGAASASGLSLKGTPPAGVVVGTNYSFQPSASVSGSGVTFSIQGQAGWMSFNAATGAVSGTPSLSDEGQTNVTITVTDGAKSASIGPFTISVVAAGTGTAALSWSAPSVNEDGSAIQGLVGYHVYYGTDAGNLENAVEVAGGTSTAYTVMGLNSGTYYFAVAAYNSDGVESSMSNIGNKTI